MQYKDLFRPKKKHLGGYGTLKLTNMFHLLQGHSCFFCIHFYPKKKKDKNNKKIQSNKKNPILITI